MATKKPQNNFRKKVGRVVESDMFLSLAIASVLLNVLFFVSIFVLTSTDTFDRRFYNSSRTRYCANVSGVEERAKELADEKTAVKEWQITCVSTEFKPFYDESVAKFNAQYPN